MTSPAIDAAAIVADLDPLPALVNGRHQVQADHPGNTREHDVAGFELRRVYEVLDPPRAIGWLTGQEKGDGELEFGGWLWRYDLAPLGSSETEVTLTYDWSAVPQYIRDRGIQFPLFGPEHLPNSLHHLASLASSA